MTVGPLMLDIEGTSVTDEETRLLREPAVGGVIFFSRNFESREQIAQLAASIRKVRPELLLAVDQEGGRVQRFRQGFTRLPPMAVLGNVYRREPETGAALLQDAGWLMAAEILAAGLDFSFAPVLDVDDNHCAVIADRAFAAEPEAVAEAASWFIRGMAEAGMAATGKHFPGHGGVAGDSHLETPVDRRSLEELERRDLIPFRRLTGELSGMMPAHIRFPEVDEQCVGFSRRWLSDILRRNLGFDGVIFSDDLSMAGAESAGGYGDRARAALAAGCDMVLVCNNRAGALEALAAIDALGATPSPRLARMAGRRRWQWSSLTGLERYRRTVQRLAEITETGDKKPC